MTRRTPRFARSGRSDGHGPYYTAIGNSRRVLWEQIKLLVALFLTACLLIALETSTYLRIRLPIFGWGAAAPSLGLLLAMAVGFHFSEEEGGVAGLLIGWLIDAAGPGGIMLSPLLYLVCGFFCGVAGRRRLAHNLPSFLIFAAGGGLLESLFSIAEAILSTKALPPVAWLWRGLVPVWVLTVMASPLLYGLVVAEKTLLLSWRNKT